MPEVARRLLGDPPKTENGGNTWRYGRKGSLAVHVGGTGGLVGTWSDWESGDRGGVLELIERERSCNRAEALKWLEREGLIPPATQQRRQGRERRAAGSKNGTTRAAQDPAKLEIPTPTSTPARTAKDRLAIAHAGFVWAAGIPADDTPGRRYLGGRSVWPPFGMDGSPNLPAEVVRWLTREAAQARDPQTGKPLLWLPGNAAGALLYAFTDETGKVVKVQVEALTHSGELTPYLDGDGQGKERFRQYRGRGAGAYMRLGPSENGELVLVEGPPDALAAWWLFPTSTVWGCSGAGGLGQVLPEHVAGFDTVILAADGDRAGRKNTWKTAQSLLEAGVLVKNWKSGPGTDPAGRMMERLAESAGKRQFEGELSPGEADARAWAPYLSARKEEAPHGSRS